MNLGKTLLFSLALLISILGNQARWISHLHLEPQNSPDHPMATYVISGSLVVDYIRSLLGMLLARTALPFDTVAAGLQNQNTAYHDTFIQSVLHPSQRHSRLKAIKLAELQDLRGHARSLAELARHLHSQACRARTLH